MTLKEWLITFLTEKGYYTSKDSDLLLEGAKDKDMMFGLSVEMMIDFIVKSGYGEKIKHNLVLLGFHNADCLDYWKHLTNGMMKESGYGEQYSDIKYAKKA